MRIAVCIKQVPTREWQPRIDETKRSVREQDASFEMNEPDAYALEEALRLREKHGGEVVVCTAGPARASQVLREALARGADRAIHVEDDRLASIGTDSFVVAGALADAVRDERFDLVLTGLQSDDQGAAQTGVILAERLGLPHATIVMDVQVNEPAVRVNASSRGVVSMGRDALPASSRSRSGINQLRTPRSKGIMAAKKKEIRKVTPSALPPSRTTVVSLDVPRKTKETQLISGSAADAAKALVDRLRNQARVIE